MLITRTCPFTGDQIAKNIAVTELQLRTWKSGVRIQIAMSNLTPDEREFIKTGITSEVWDRIFTFNSPD